MHSEMVWREGRHHMWDMLAGEILHQASSLSWYFKSTLREQKLTIIFWFTVTQQFVPNYTASSKLFQRGRNTIFFRYLVIIELHLLSQERMLEPIRNIWNNTLVISQLQCSWLHSSTTNAECRSFCYINKLWIWSNSSSYRRIMLSYNRYNCKYLQKIQSAYFLFVPKFDSNILKHPPSVDGSPGLPRRPLGFPRWPRCLHRCNGHCKVWITSLKT